MDTKLTSAITRPPTPHIHTLFREMPLPSLICHMLPLPPCPRPLSCIVSLPHSDCSHLLTVLQASLSPGPSCKRLGTPDFPPNFRSDSSVLSCEGSGNFRSTSPQSADTKGITEPGINHLQMSPPASRFLAVTHPRYHHYHHHPQLISNPFCKQLLTRFCKQSLEVGILPSMAVAPRLIPGHSA